MAVMSLFGSMPSVPADRPENGSPQPSVPIFNTKNKNSPSTVIAKGVRLEGDFKSQGDVLIEGEVVGSISTDSLLTVGNDALLKAGVQASEAVIAGRVEGNLNIINRLEIKGTAKIKGDIVCQTVVVEAGAVLQGNMKSGDGSKAEDNPSAPVSKPNIEQKPSA